MNTTPLTLNLYLAVGAMTWYLIIGRNRALFDAAYTRSSTLPYALVYTFVFLAITIAWPLMLALIAHEWWRRRDRH